MMMMRVTPRAEQKQQTGPGLRQQQQQHPHHKGSSVLVEARLSARLSTEFEMLRLGGTMCGFSALLSVLVAGLAAASSDLFDNQLGDINYCKKQCQLTIKNKSPAKVSGPWSRGGGCLCVLPAASCCQDIYAEQQHTQPASRM